MPERPADSRDRDDLRGRAEAAVGPSAVTPSEQLALDEAGRALHELRVHQVELEMQNEELRRIQAELELTRARYLDLFDRAPIGYIVFDEEGLIHEANLAAATLLAVPADKLLGRPVTGFIAPEDQDGFYLLRRRLSVGGPSQDGDFRLIRQDADPALVRIDASSVSDAGGPPVYRAALSDITGRKAAEAEILRLNCDLERRVTERTAGLQTAVTELETFNYSASHDLRAPLRAINGFASLLERHQGAVLDETSRRYLHLIQTASERLGILLEELLDYSRLGRDGVRAEPVPLAPLVAGLCDVYGDRLAAVGGRLALAEPHAVPIADPHLLERILANLVENALVYRRPDVPPLVTVSAVSCDGTVTVSVADNGIGIPGGQLEQIFALFTRLHGEDEYPGTGIGLSIARKAAVLMGTDVTVTSVEGQGSTFSLVLPAAAAAADG